MKNKVSSGRQVGQRVESAPGSIVHEYVGRDGKVVRVARDARGRLLPGAALERLQDLASKREPVNNPSVVRRALGLGSRWAGRAAKREGGEA